jgi:hypothetical protein
MPAHAGADGERRLRSFSAASLAGLAFRRGLPISALNHGNVRKIAKFARDKKRARAPLKRHSGPHHWAGAAEPRNRRFGTNDVLPSYRKIR